MLTIYFSKIKLRIQNETELSTNKKIRIFRKISLKIIRMEPLQTEVPF